MKKAFFLLNNVGLLGFDAYDGLMLYGMLKAPRPKTDYAILHVHGLTGSFYGSNSIPDIAKKANNKGIAFMSILTRGSYVVEEFSYADKKRLLAGGALERFEDSVYDIEGGIKALLDMGYSKIFIEGHSTGCQKLLYYMNSRFYKKHIKNIAGISLISPVDDYSYDLHKLGENRYYKKIKLAKKIKGKSLFMPMEKGHAHDELIGVNRFLSTALKTNPESKALYYHGNLAYISGIKAPLMAIFGSNDEYMVDTSPLEALELIKSKYTGRSIETRIIKNTGHTFRGKREELANALVNFYSMLKRK